MIRWGVLGGRWGPVPWPIFLVLGAAFLGSAGLLAVLTWGSPWFGLRLVEASGALVAGTVLLAVGFHRRARSPPARPPVE